jgi:hypothetical protein
VETLFGLNSRSGKTMSQTLIQEGKEDIQAKRDKILHQKQKINDVLDSHLFEDTLNCVPQSIAIIKSNRNTSDIVLPDLEYVD